MEVAEIECRPSGDAFRTTDAEPRARLAQAIVARDEAAIALDAATERSATARAAHDAKRKAFAEADATHRETVASGSEDNIVLRAWHKREERRVLCDAADAAAKQAALEATTAQNLLDARHKEKERAVGALLAMDAARRACIVKAKAESLVDEAISLFAMRQRVGACGETSPVLDRLLSSDAFFALICKLPEFGERFVRANDHTENLIEQLSANGD